VMAGLLVIGFICNMMIRPVAAEHHMPADSVAGEPLAAGAK